MRDPQGKVSSEVSNSFTNVVYENCTHKNWVEAVWEGRSITDSVGSENSSFISLLLIVQLPFFGNIFIFSSFKMFHFLSVTENYHFSFPFQAYSAIFILSPLHGLLIHSLVGGLLTR